MKPSENMPNMFISKSDMTHGHRHLRLFHFLKQSLGGEEELVSLFLPPKARLIALFSVIWEFNWRSLKNNSKNTYIFTVSVKLPEKLRLHSQPPSSISHNSLIRKPDITMSPTIRGLRIIWQCFAFSGGFTAAQKRTACLIISKSSQ